MKTQKTRWSQLSAMLYFATAISLLSSVKGQCSQSGITLTGTSGNVSSPSYPSNYPNRQTCRWIITVPQGYLVRLSFEVFQLETCAVPSPVCSCDHVEVRDGRDGSSKQLGRYCGNDQPSPVHSSGRFMWMEFDTDLTGNEKGFLANFIAVAIPTSLSTSAAAPGLCSNPKHPPNCSDILFPICCYDNGPSCCPRGGNRCSDETNTTRDYCPRSSDESIKTECCFVDGKPSCCTPESIGVIVGISIGGGVFLLLLICLCCCFRKKIFETTLTLFSSVRGQCSSSGTTLTGSSGSFSSPNYPSNYPNRETCRWIITVPQGHIVLLSFQSFHLESCFRPSPDCSCDYLEVRDGTTGSSELLGRYCGKEYAAAVQSSGRSMWIEFDTDLFSNEKGFFVKYTAVDVSQCPNNGVLRGANGSFTSPGFPLTYPVSVTCTWIIEVPEGYQVQLTFTTFQLGYCVVLVCAYVTMFK
ncbi:hypothetical protein ACROYT_G007677 [Oculina patagonica]